MNIDINTPRYIFNTLTVVSLLLMLGMVGLWMGLGIIVGTNFTKGDI